MSGINGIDPILIDNIKVLTQKLVITETSKSKVMEDKKDDNRRQKRSWPFSKQDLPRLKSAVGKLNRLLHKNEIPLFFQISGDYPDFVVQLLSMDGRKLISRVQPGRIFELVANFDTRGFTVDELI